MTVLNANTAFVKVVPINVWKFIEIGLKKINKTQFFDVVNLFDFNIFLLCEGFILHFQS